MDLIENFEGDQMRHWYYLKKYKLIKKMILNYCQEDLIIADIGAGTAPFSRQIVIDFPKTRVYAVDINYSIEDLKKSDGNFNYVMELPSTIKPNIFLLNDVLEHIADDQYFLNELVLKASKSSIFVITVPALRILWTGHDIYLKHYRRYNSRELKKLLTTCNLHVQSSHYIFGTILPVALFRKLLYGKNVKSQLKNNGSAVNWMMRIILSCDVVISRILNSGISLIALAEKK